VEPPAEAENRRPRFYQGRVGVVKSTREYLRIHIPIELFRSLDPGWKPPRYHVAYVYPSRVIIEFAEPQPEDAEAEQEE